MGNCCEKNIRAFQAGERAGGLGLNPGGKNLLAMIFYFLPVANPAAFPSQVIDDKITGSRGLPVEIIAQLPDTFPVITVAAPDF